MDSQIVLYIARHGRTEMNESGLFRGDADPPLDKNGYRDANELAFWLAPVEISFIASSDKKRAMTTADIISVQKKLTDDSPELNPIYSEVLRPWNVGDFGGQPKTDENLKELQKYIENPNLVVPGGTSLNEFRSRVTPAFEEAVEVSMANGCPGLLVCHSSVIHEAGNIFGGHHEAGHVMPGGVAAVYIKNGKLDIEPIFKADKRATSQNVLGVASKTRSGLSS